MHNFSFKRFALLIKHDIVINKYRYAIFAILCVLLLQVPYILYFKRIANTDPNLHIIVYRHTIHNIGSMIYCALFTFAASMLFFDYKKMSGVCNYIMLPATSLEKFLSKIFVTIVGTFIITELGVAIGLLFYKIGCSAMGLEITSHLMCSELPNALSFTIYSIGFNFSAEDIEICLIFLTIYSLFLLGSAYFKQYVWAKVFALLMLVMFEEIYMERKFELGIYNSMEKIISTVTTPETTEIIVKITLWTLLLIYIWYLTYRIFKNKQYILTRK